MRKVVGCLLAGLLLLGIIIVGPLVLFNEEPRAGRDLLHPLSRLEFHSPNEVFIHAASDVSINDLFDLSIFEGFWPGITAEQARRAAGPPQRTYQQYSGRDTFYVFPQRRGKIEVFSQQVDSEGFQGLNWFLRWRPANQKPDAYLSPAILALIPDLPESVSINVQSKDGAVNVKLAEGALTEVVWLRKGPQPEVPAYRDTAP